MYYCVYILLSLRDKKLYVGCTKDVEKRLKKHNCGAVIATKNRRPFSLIYMETFENKGQAYNRERLFLKSLWGSRFKKKVLDKYMRSLQNPKDHVL